MDWEHAFGQQISDAPGPEPGRHVDHQAYGWFPDIQHATKFFHTFLICPYVAAISGRVNLVILRILRILKLTRSLRVHAHCSEQSPESGPLRTFASRQPSHPDMSQTPRHDAPLFRLARLGGCGQCFSPLLVPLQHRNCGMDGTRPVRLVACHCQRS